MTSEPVVTPVVTPVDDPTPYVTIKRLERTLANERRFSAKATRQLHRAMLREVREADQRARAAEERARDAEDRLTRATQRTASARARARQAELELERIKKSSTWRAGRTVLAVPSRIKRWGRS